MDEWGKGFQAWEWQMQSERVGQVWGGSGWARIKDEVGGGVSAATAPPRPQAVRVRGSIWLRPLKRPSLEHQTRPQGSVFLFILRQAQWIPALVALQPPCPGR